MATKEIPAKFVFTCDRCGATHVQEQTQGSQPEEWCWARFSRASTSVWSVLLCSQCSTAVMDFAKPHVNS